MPKLARTLDSLHVPVIFNGKELENTDHDKKTMNLFQLVGEYIKLINTAPPYQRDSAWAVPKEQQFIASCFSNVMPIPPMYVCRKTDRQNCAQLWALDCRQRITAISNFIGDRFKVPVAHTFSDGVQKIKKLYWSEIKDNADYVILKQAFHDKSIDLVVFEYMPLEDQRKVFSGLNNGVPLNVDEQIYCNYFLSRRICDEVFDRIFGKIKNLMPSSVREGKRFRHIRTIHEILLLCGDVNLMGEPAARGIRKQERMNSAKFIHEKLKAEHFDYTDIVTDNILVALNLKEKLPILKGITDVLSNVLETNSTLMRSVGKPNNPQNPYVDSRNVVDVTSFLYKMVKEKKITVSRLSSIKDELVKFLGKYHEQKDSLGVNQSTTDFDVLDKKFRAMAVLFHKYLA